MTGVSGQQAPWPSDKRQAVRPAHAGRPHTALWGIETGQPLRPPSPQQRRLPPRKVPDVCSTVLHAYTQTSFVLYPDLLQNHVRHLHTHLRRTLRIVRILRIMTQLKVRIFDILPRMKDVPLRRVRAFQNNSRPPTCYAVSMAGHARQVTIQACILHCKY